jgi:hypothetical protein
MPDPHLAIAITATSQSTDQTTLANFGLVNFSPYALFIGIQVRVDARIRVEYHAPIRQLPCFSVCSNAVDTDLDIGRLLWLSLLLVSSHSSVPRQIVLVLRIGSRDRQCATV